MPSLIIRRYRHTDNENVRNLYKLSSIHSEIGYRSGPWEADFNDMEGHYFNGGEFLVGLVDNKIVAMGGYRKMLHNIAQIRRMRVHPDHRRKGYAQQIIQKLEEAARKSKFSEIQLKTSTQQKMAQSFYEKNGYVKMEKEKEYYTEGGGNSFEVVWYRKQL
ncbi:MAG: GNAT family N-acetyltransferase [Patescibacteria group bacterium]|jgi:ribosomal protein S18 acetylase RimI-like enzyme